MSLELTYLKASGYFQKFFHRKPTSIQWLYPHASDVALSWNKCTPRSVRWHHVMSGHLLDGSWPQLLSVIDGFSPPPPKTRKYGQAKWLYKVRFDVFCWILFWMKIPPGKKCPFCEKSEGPPLMDGNDIYISCLCQVWANGVRIIWSSLISDINHGNHLEPVDFHGNH